MSKILAKVRITRGREIELPGSPISISPPQFNEALELGQFGFTTDTARLFIGHVPESGDINFNRTDFPYQNIEVLTETSPRVKELFSEFNRSKNENSFFLPTIVQAGAAEINYSDYSGNEIPSRFYADNFSATVEYHCFDAGTNEPIQAGKLYIVSTSATSSIVNESAGGVIDFTLVNGSGYRVLRSNNTVPIKFFMKKTVLSGLTDGELV